MNDRLVGLLVSRVYNNLQNLQEKKKNKKSSSQKKYNKRKSHQFYLGGYGYQENPKNDFFDFTGSYNDYEGSGGGFEGGIEEEVEVNEEIDQNKDGKNDFTDVKIARMLAAGVSKEEIKKKYPELFKGSQDDLDEFVEMLKERKKRKRRKKKKKPTPNKYQRTKYKARSGTKRGDTMARLSNKIKKGKKLTKADYKARDDSEAAERKKKGYKSKPRFDTGMYISEAKKKELDEFVEMLEERKKRRKKRKKSTKKKKKSSAGKLSAKTKETLKKKAKKRGLTPSSVYAEYRKGLAAYYSSGSRKGMSAHQWAHARVNSANPSKSWAVVKKAKGGKKK